MKITTSTDIIVSNKGQAKALREIQSLTEDVQREIEELTSRTMTAQGKISTGMNVDADFLGHTPNKINHTMSRRQAMIEMAVALDCEGEHIQLAARNAAGIWFTI